ncbi:hypothetical protein [Asaccharospora irregularis]|uniref:Uncharacterized protein n=1 Tax=Asaccharospora irregularis DSM 2635 TaxID=1121321 RepID=A0A1M5RD23_9FIRM|nr:hypothetical protein [Asaccharospora irregularis]SHH24194.1 hypothetical protein SAMN04488530_12913 [Asaccharospora irregularis DSM 2635]
MNLVGIENITPYKNIFEFNVYKYEDEIDLGNKDLFVCELKVIPIDIEDVYVQRLNRSVEVLALIKNLNQNLDKISILEEIKDFILEEIWIENLEKENIHISFIES